MHKPIQANHLRITETQNILVSGYTDYLGSNANERRPALATVVFCPPPQLSARPYLTTCAKMSTWLANLVQIPSYTLPLVVDFDESNATHNQSAPELVEYCWSKWCRSGRGAEPGEFVVKNHIVSSN